MKKRHLLLATIVFFAVAGSGMVSYAVDVPATANIQAGSLSLTKTTDLNFGTIVSGTQASNITIDASAGSATPVCTSGNAAVSGGTSGLVTVGTNIDADVTISYAITGSDSTAETLEDASGNSMIITTADITTYSTGSPLAITVAGPNVIHVGGILAVGPSQTAGTYTGNCVVTVSY